MSSEDFFLKVGDTAHDLEVVLELEGVRIDLSPPATVRFQMKDERTGATKIDTEAIPDDDQVVNRGLVRYSWSDDDVDRAGNYLGEFKVTHANGKVSTYPNGDNYIHIEIGEGVADAT